QSSGKPGNAHRTIGPAETDESRCRHRDSTRPRIAGTKTNYADGRLTARSSYEGRNRHKSREGINGETPAFAELRRGKWAVLAKRYPDRGCSRCADHRIDPLESGSQGLVKSGEHRLVS